ncbi:MAG: hypothetical protein ACK2TS_06400 [Anaerolineales bacterium]
MSNLQIRLISAALGMIAGAILGTTENVLGVGVFIICAVLFLVEYFRAQKV